MHSTSALRCGSVFGNCDRFVYKAFLDLELNHTLNAVFCSLGFCGIRNDRKVIADETNVRYNVQVVALRKAGVAKWI